MEGISPGLAICLVAGLVVAINAGLVIMLRNSGAEIEMLRRAGRVIRDPLRPQREQMEELRGRVRRLTEEESE